MPSDSGLQGGDLFIVDNSDADWKVRDYLREWTDLAHSLGIATGYFEIGALPPALGGVVERGDRLHGGAPICCGSHHVGVSSNEVKRLGTSTISGTDLVVREDHEDAGGR